MKDIKNYEGLYAITEDGMVWSHTTNRFLKSKADKNGYLTVNLSKEGKAKTSYLHRLVAETYIPNPEGKKQVNHKDENKTNNSVSNLEWLTAKENCNYGSRNARLSGAKGKKVYCVELDKVFKNQSTAARELNIDKSSISKCCNGKVKTAGGYHWRDAE